MDLASLIVTAKGDRSYDRLAADCGGSPGAARLQQLATRTVRNFPDPPTIRALATGLGVSERTVVLAAAESLGIDTADAAGGLAALLPPSADQLSERQVAAVLATIRAMVDPGPTSEVADLATWSSSKRAQAAIDERVSRPPAEKRAARRPKEGPPQPIS